MQFAITNAILLVLIKSVTCWTSLGHPKVITRFENLDNFYLALREKNPLSTEILQVNSNQSDLFCKTLLEAQYFATRLEKYVKMNTSKIVMELSKYKPSIIDQFYADRKVFKFCLTIFGPGCLYELKYDRKTVSVGNTRVPEFLHLCLARQGQTETFKEYYITRPYPTRIADNRRNNIAFLFSYNQNGELALNALIEEAAVDHSRVSIEKSMYLEELYLRHKNNPTPTEKNTSWRSSDSTVEAPSTSTLCHLPADSKLRLCAAVMNMQIYKPGFTFWAHKFNVEYTCKERQLSFDTVTPEYKEWTLGCKAREHRTGKKRTVYVSQDIQCESTAVMYVDFEGKLIPLGQSRYVTVLY